MTSTGKRMTSTGKRNKRLATKLPYHTAVAVSGGPDSMVLLDFLNKTPNRVQLVIHVKYEDSEEFRATKLQQEYRNAAAELVAEYCEQHGIELLSATDVFTSEKAASENRRKLYDTVFAETGLPVAVGHTVDDAYEWYLIRTLGCLDSSESAWMRAESGSVYRPFLLMTRDWIYEQAEKHNVRYVRDPSNISKLGNTRARMRALGLRDSIKEVFPQMYAAFRNKLTRTVLKQQKELT